MQSRLPPIQQIGDYKVNTPLQKDPRSLQDQVRDLLGNAAGETLFTSEPESRVAREKFYRFCERILINGPKLEAPSGKGVDRDVITMKDFLGKEGIDLYRKALKEERNSNDFRSAVVLKSKQFIPGSRLQKSVIEVIGGVSGSGKTTGADAASIKICETLPNRGPRNTEGNVFISVDGGIERQVSQMRGLLLQVAKANGYPGIEDINDKAYKLSVKKYVQHAALLSDQVHVKIPLTFANPLEWNTTLALEKKHPDKIIAFGMTVPVAGRSPEEYRDLINRMGTQRAWLEKYGLDVGSASEISMNNHDIGCESKRYEAQFFSAGLYGTSKEQQAYLTESEHKIYFEIVNDLMYVHKNDDDQWVKCLPGSEEMGVKVSERDFLRWQEEEKKNSARTPDLPVWLLFKKRERDLAPVVINTDVRNEFLKKDIKSFFNRYQSLAEEVKEICNSETPSTPSSGRGSGFFSNLLTRARTSSAAGRGRSDSVGSKNVGDRLRSLMPAATSRSNSSSIIESGENSANSSIIDSSVIDSLEARELLIDRLSKLTSDIVASGEDHSAQVGLLKKIGEQLVNLCKINNEDTDQEISSKEGLQLKSRAMGAAKTIKNVTKEYVFAPTLTQQAIASGPENSTSMIQQGLNSPARPRRGADHAPPLPVNLQVSSQEPPVNEPRQSRPPAKPVPMPMPMPMEVAKDRPPAKKAPILDEVLKAAAEAAKSAPVRTLARNRPLPPGPPAQEKPESDEGSNESPRPSNYRGGPTHGKG